MAIDRTTYQHPLQGRYASKDMKSLWSDYRMKLAWRDIWIKIAELEMRLGVTQITPAQIAAMKAGRENIDFELAASWEKRLRHDVLAHIRAFAKECPEAESIIHLGCTSCEITDNAELIIIREALKLISIRLATVIDRLNRFSLEHRCRPTLGFTHFQPAQPVTVGKRACMWNQDLILDLEAIVHLIDNLRFRGIKGTVGTQASFLELFDGDEEKVKELDRLFTASFGFKRRFLITGQTYTRKQDVAILSTLAALGASVKKMATDLRLLAHMKEIEEPFKEEQKGSSAMPYKRNPMLDERSCSLDRYLINLAPNALQTHAEQWLERSLDDSANRRLVFSEAFLTADAILLIMQNVSEGLVVYPKMIERHLKEELPFMATENIIAAMVKAGGSRQEAHERIAVLSRQAAKRVKEEGLDNNLIELIRENTYFEPILGELDGLLDPKTFIGRAPGQVSDFQEEVFQVLAPFSHLLSAETAELNV